MSIKMRKVALVFLSVLLVLSLTACGSGVNQQSSQPSASPADSAAQPPSGETPTLYVALAEAAAQEGQIDFVTENLPIACADAGIDVNLEFDVVAGDEQSYATRIRTLLAAGAEELDLWWDRGGSFVIPIFNANSALPVDDYIKDNKRFWDAVIPGMMKPNDDGHYYAIPNEQMNWEIVYYNMRVLNKYGLQIPKTANEFTALCETLIGEGIRPITVRGKPGWPVAMMVEGFANTIDPQITYKIVNGEATFDSEPYRESTDFVKKLLDMGAFSANAAMDNTDECRALFLNDEAAVWFNISSQLAPLSLIMGEDIQWAAYPVLREEDAGNFGKNCAGGLKPNSGTLVNANTQYPQLATDVAVELSLVWSQFYYEIGGSPLVPYNAEVLGWNEPESGVGPAALSLAAGAGEFEFTFPFVQDVMPTTAGTTMLIESSSKLISDMNYTTDKYIADLNAALAEE